MRVATSCRVNAANRRFCGPDQSIELSQFGDLSTSLAEFAADQQVLTSILLIGIDGYFCD
ncbi:MAG TPA: hypothetical protein DDW52_09625 [Planctomycetaceae bacterium]|nr:hypothetical protein [Planctomycetaceae bacterium]